MESANAKKNLAHMAPLAVWAVMGLVFTFKSIFVSEFFTVADAGIFWLWFAGLAAVTTAVVSKVKTPMAALGVHAAAFLLINLIPRVYPFDYLRIGYDLIRTF